ncbi:uncharacterized protein LOC115214019 [Octopus sinensis]|uniref:Uncharacterized protein LOC115214019 n=1 Tax=Octopus sinensis TaxID=2607531 RepID=A0A6P7SKT2_9MOLL|nr:uncharacterized protein LOC115214019 [Octopus sinensis]
MKLSNQSTAQHIKSRSTLRSSDGQALLTDIASILNRWSEYFQALFSAVRVVQENTILHIQQQPVSMELDEPPALEETRLAIGWLKSRKTAGVDGIPSEIWKYGGPDIHAKLHELLVACWEQGKLRQDLHNIVIIPLYKNKGEKSDGSNYRGITPFPLQEKF